MKGKRKLKDYSPKNIFIVMIYTHTIGRIGKDCKTITGAPKEIIAVGGEENPALHDIYERIGKDGTQIYTDKFDIYDHRDSADVGISTAEFCVAETGSLCVDNYSYEARVTSMLPFVNIVFVNANYIVKDVTVACQIIGKVFDKGYLGFVTGPSRTADIERVLSLGVHGPNKLLIIAVENVEGGR